MSLAVTLTLYHTRYRTGFVKESHRLELFFIEEEFSGERNGGCRTKKGKKAKEESELALDWLHREPNEGDHYCPSQSVTVHSPCIMREVRQPS